MGKVAAIVQSSYIPWKGYFDLINSADEFILLDDVQFTRRDWRNRNLVKAPTGLLWLTIPVAVKGKYFQRICETAISDPGWRERHWQGIVHNYSRARHFQTYKEVFEELYAGATHRLLSEVNLRFLSKICSVLGITTRLSWSTEHEHAEGKTERLVSRAGPSAPPNTSPGRPPRPTSTKRSFARRASRCATWITRGIRNTSNSIPHSCTG